MELKLITGRAKSGKSEYLYNDALKKLDAKNGNILYIVPEQMTYSTELDIIKKINDAGLLDMQIISFTKLEYMVFDEVGGLKLQNINDYGKVMLLKQICDKSADELSVYRRAMHKDGFLREFNSFIKELKKNKIEVSKLEQLDISGISSELLKRKVNDIALIYKRIEEITKNNFYDDQDKTNRFINIIGKSETIRNSYIYIDNFESLVGQRLEIIKQLIRYSRGVTISINIDNNCLDRLENIDDYEIFKVTYDTLNEYKNLAYDIGVKPEIIKLNNSYINNKEISIIDKTMFTMYSEKYEEELNSIKVFSSMNTYSEVENVCRRIISLVRDSGYRYKDIAVVTSSMDSYSINVQKVFTQFDIPYFIDMKKDIMNNPFVKYILSVLDMLNYNFKHQSVFEFFKTGFSGLDYGQVEKLENFALEYGIEGNRWFKPFKMNIKNIQYYEDLRQSFADDFENLRSKFKKLKTSEDITVFLYNVFKIHNVQQSIEKKVDEFKHKGLYELSFVNAQVWNVIIDIFEQIILTSKDVEITPAQYRKILEAGLSEIELGIIPPTLDKVVVGDLDRAFINRYKVIFLMGANEGVLLSYGDDKGLLLDDEKDTLKSLGLPLLNTGAYNSYKQKHILYKVLTKPTDYLFVSYALSTVDGKALQPSMQIDKLKQIFTQLSIESDLSDNDELRFIMAKKATLEVLIEKLREFIDGKPLSDVWKDVYSWYQNNSKALAYIIDNGLSYKNIADKIKDTDIDRLYGEYMTMSVSKLENFAACPFKFFLDFGIKPAPRRELKVEYYDIGNIFHECIERFTNKIIDNTIDLYTADKNMVTAHIKQCINEVLANDLSGSNALEYNERNKYLKHKIKRLLERAAWTMVSQLKKGSFKPNFTEFDIKKEIVGISKNILLEGRVDRIDLYEDGEYAYINIIDYKSSKRDIVLSDVMSGLQLQLFVYLSSIINIKDRISELIPKIGGVFYFNIDDPYIDGDSSSLEQYEDEIFKELSLKGYVLEDMNVISNIDRDIEAVKSSNVIPVSLKADNTLSKSSKVLNDNEYRLILDKVDKIACDLSKEILDGKIDINPYKKDTNKTPCSYCDYKTVCQFDSSIDGNKYRNIKKSSKDEIISLLLLDNTR